MKSRLLIVLLIGSLQGFSQSLTDSMMYIVENGPGKQTVLPAGSAIEKKNTYGRLKFESVNGLSIAVINNYKIEWSKTYGVADNSKGDSVTTETLFQSASIGKVITAMAVLRLVREAKIGLDENVNNKLANWKVEENNFTAKEKVTLRRCCHTRQDFLTTMALKVIPLPIKSLPFYRY